jgi:hypothetical protein
MSKEGDIRAASDGYGNFAGKFAGGKFCYR